MISNVMHIFSNYQLYYCDTLTRSSNCKSTCLDFPLRLSTFSRCSVFPIHFDDLLTTKVQSQSPTHAVLISMIVLMDNMQLSAHRAMLHCNFYPYRWCSLCIYRPIRTMLINFSKCAAVNGSKHIYLFIKIQ